jgi:group I intron endonuclease
MLIYLVRNRVNGKIYIGKTVKTVERRWKEHCYTARNNGRARLSTAIRKYGEDCFEVTTLVSGIESLETLNALEIEYIAKYRSTEVTVGYNIAHGGDGGARPCSEERRAELRIKMTGSGNPFFGKKHSPETRQKFVESRVGIKQTVASKRKRSDALKGRSQTPEMVARRLAGFTKESRAKISATLRARPVTQQTRDKRSASLRGKKRSPESVARIRAASALRRNRVTVTCAGCSAVFERSVSRGGKFCNRTCWKENHRRVAKSSKRITGSPIEGTPTCSI